MDYGNLLSRAFNIAWGHKRLWVLGFFAASFGTLGELRNLISDETPMWLNEIYPGLGDMGEEFLFSAAGIAIIAAIVLSLLVIALFFIVMHFISVGGLICGVLKVENKEEYRLKQLFKFGMGYFLRFLGLFFVFIFSFIIFFALMILPMILAFVLLGAYGLFFLIPVIPVAMAGIFLLSTMYSLAQREIIVNETPLFEAIGEAYRLITGHLGANIIIFILSLALGLMIMVTALFIIAVCAIPFVIVGIQSILLLILTLVVVLPIFIAITVIVEGFLGTFFNALMTLFYLELRKMSPYRKQTIGGTGLSTQSA